ncbi:MAG: hypothetical protein HRU05_00955 [Oceanospirillaceae bacterium]|nr:hypothetical protein [Oceanospirillaceae bacterium]
MSEEEYMEWEVVEEMPIGWHVDKTVGRAPLAHTVFITNGKSVLNGQKRALLRIEAKQTKSSISPVLSLKAVETAKEDPSTLMPFPAKTVNHLARKKFQEQILKEIMFDLTVCEIEGWDKSAYIKELKKLLNSINLPKKRKQQKHTKTPTLFDELTIDKS